MEAEVPDSFRYDTVIFDLDGTLTRSGIGIINCVKYALTRLGRPIPDEDTLMRFVGPPLLESFIRYAGMDEDEAKRGVDIYRERFDAIGWRENEVYAGIATLLRTLKAHGEYVAVAESADGLDHLQRIAHGLTQRTVHIGDQGHRMPAGMFSDGHHGLRQADGILRCFHKGPAATFYIQ